MFDKVQHMFMIKVLEELGHMEDTCGFFFFSFCFVLFSTYMC